MNPGLDCEIVVNFDAWPADFEPAAKRALAAVLEELPGSLAGDAELSVLLTGDGEQRRLNARWRKIDKTTNVLSFPAHAPGVPFAGPLGEISLAWQTLVREADLAAIPLEHHFAHLLVHGFLHILGYDHLSDADADRMQALETRILARLSIPDPHAAAHPVPLSP